MDAAQKLFKNIVILSTAVLLMATLGLAQTLNVTTAVSFGGTGGQDVPVTSSGSPGTEINFTVGAPSYTTDIAGSGDWLRATGTGTTPGFISFSLKSAPQKPGVHTATVSVTGTANPGGANVNAVTITVTYNSGSSGGGTSNTLNATLNGAAVTSAISMSAALNGIDSKQIVLTTSSTTGVTLSLGASSATWLTSYLGTSSITPAAGTTLMLYANAAGLSAGTYSGSIIITPYIGTTAGTAVTLTVSFTVGSGTSNGTWSVSQSSFALSYTTNSQSYPTTGNIYPSTTSTTSVCTSSTTSCYNMTGPTSNNGWLVLTFPTASGPFTNPTQIPMTTPFVLSVGTAANALTAGTYSGSVNILDTSGVQQLTVTVTLTVNGGGTNTLTLSPSSVPFTAALNGASQSQTVTVTSSAGGTFYVSGSLPTGLNYSYTSITLAAGGSTSFTVTANPSNLAANTYAGTLYVYVGSQSASLPVSLVVGSGSGTGTGTSAVAPTSLSFFYKYGTDPVNFISRQKLAITGTAGAWSSSITTTTGTAWLRLSPSSGSSLPASSGDAPTVIVDATDLSVGTYGATIAISTVGGYQTINVTLSVGTSTILLPTPGDVVFYATSTGNKPLPQYMGFSASDSAAGAMGITAQSNNSWITLVNSDTASTNIQVDPTGMSTGVYTGSITVTQANVANSPLTIPVIMVVNGGGSGGTVTSNITAAPTSLTYSTGLGASPASQSISVTSASGTAAVSFTAAVTSGANWLSVSPASGSTPSTLTAAVNSSSLAAGSYAGTIVITPTGGNPVTVAVSLNVSAAPAVSATPTQLTFTYTAGQAVPAAQQVTVAGGAFTATASSTGNWLSVSPTSGTAAGTITVSVAPSSLAAGTYTGTIVVAGVSPATGSTTVNVTITVTAPLPTLTKVTNAASYAIGSIAPGEIITLFASDTTHPIGPTTPVTLALDSTTGKVATSLGGVQVTVNGYAAPLIYVSASQISAVVPYEVKAFVSATVQVKYLGQTSNGISLNVATTAPALFTANSSGTGPGAILDSDGSVNSAANPAARGDIIVVYLTGEGETSPAGVTGKVTTVASSAPLTPGPLLQPTVTIGGQGADWTFAGEAPGFISGVMQLNIKVPTNIAAGDQPIVVSFGGNPSQTGVTVSVK